jgi:hypothetical protein
MTITGAGSAEAGLYTHAAQLVPAEGKRVSRRLAVIPVRPRDGLRAAEVAADPTGGASAVNGPIFSS